jgi:hypothetical protein
MVHAHVETWSVRLGRLGLAVVLLACASCAHLPFRKPAGPANIAPSGQNPLTIPELQSEVMRFADTYTNSVAHAADRVAKQLKTREAEVAALRWKLEQATAAYVNATGENPLWNALDMVAFSTVSRMVAEDVRSRELFGGDLQLLVDTHRELEASSWSIADQFLSPSERRELEDLIAEWRKQNPNERSVSAVHFRDFAFKLGKASQPGKIKPTSLFSMLYLDPFAGLDPTTVAIEQSRELAERTVAYAERMPTLLRWQAELLAYQLASQTEAQRLLADADRVSLSAESLSKTAAELPALVDEQRKAALDQFFAGLTAQREAILANLDANSAKVNTLLGSTRQTLEAGTQMSNSLDATIKSLDAFLRYVSPPASKTAPPAGAPGKPFDVGEYGKAATDIAAMAQNLTTLLRSLDASAPRVAALSQQTAQDLRRVVDHAFWRGLVLVLILLVGSVFAALAYRALARRWLSPAEIGPRAGG